MGDVAGHEDGAPHGALVLTRSEQGAVLPLADLRVGTQGQVAGMPCDQPIERPQAIGRVVRPGIDCRVVSDPGPDGVPIQVPEGGQGLGILLDQTGAIAPLQAPHRNVMQHPGPIQAGSAWHVGRPPAEREGKVRGIHRKSLLHPL